jgi:hypothetical protein
MKRYEKLLKVINELEEKDRQIELARDDNYEKIKKAQECDKKELEKYDNKLLEMHRVVNKQLESHRKQLQFIQSKDYEWSAMFDFDGLYYRYKVMDLEELPRFFAWLEMMNEEVQA